MTDSNVSIDIKDTSYSYKESQQPLLEKLSDRVQEMRKAGKLTDEFLGHIRGYFRIKSIYHSNAIEGNTLDIGETRQVVEQGLTLTGKPLKDQAEAKNLGEALDFLEDLIGDSSNKPLTETDVRTLHQLVLQGIDDDNAGKYRAVPVEISGSDYSPPAPESVPSEMEEFGAWLASVSVANDNYGLSDAILYAAAAHTWFVSIHPFIDGNGRVARLLMNLVLMRYAFPIAIITKEDRMRYYDALEESQASDLSPFISLVVECIEEILEPYEEAAKEQKERQEWIAAVSAKYSGDMARIKNEYEVWKSAMELLRGYFRQMAELLNESIFGGRIYFRDFDMLDFEKYWSLSERKSAKRTWFFRADFLIKGKSARYLFFFGSASWKIRSENEITVTLHLSREEPSDSFHYERLDNITAPNVPNIVEIGYLPEKEQFVSIGKTGSSNLDKIEKIGKDFFDQVLKRHFQQ